MIKNIRHKGLKRFYETGKTSGIQKQHEKRWRLILTRLDSSQEPRNMALPGLRLHKLSGDLKNFYAVTVQANWRIIFKFAANHVHVKNLVDMPLTDSFAIPAV